MKIAFLVWRFPVLSEPFILNQITGLIDRGHEVDIYACAVDQDTSHGTTKVHPVVEQYRLLERTYYAPRRPESEFWRWLKGLGLFLSNFAKNPSICWKLSNQLGSKQFYRTIPFLGKKSYDIVHCQFGTLGLVGLSLLETGAIGGKLITTFRGIDISRYVQEQGREIYSQLFEKGSFFLANCEFFRQRAISIGCDPEQIIVHGSGIDCRKFAFKPRKFPTDGIVRIATTGRLVEKKGIEYCIDAIAQIAHIHPNIEFNIIGDGPLRQNLEAQIAKLNLARIVKLLGWKNQRELVEILDNSHIFIATSVTAADGNQDAPVNTLKEAMAMGLPAIGTYHGGIPELVEDVVSGFLVPERDAGAIAIKLLYLIEHPEIWEQMGMAGRHQVEAKYDMETLNDELTEFYQRIISRGNVDIDSSEITFKNQTINQEHPVLNQV
jgi:colanic acid/amylovoran biosynthesis glycosyltransferase